LSWKSAAESREAKKSKPYWRKSKQNWYEVMS